MMGTMAHTRPATPTCRTWKKLAMGEDEIVQEKTLS